MSGTDPQQKKTPSENTVVNDDEQPSLVVGLGASAGGIQALKKFFTEVDEHSGMSYVVILHMSPEHESRLAEVLQPTTPIPVSQVQDSERIKPDHVYVIPPNKLLAITDGHLQLSPITGFEERRSPIDLFFRTLAEKKDSAAVAVVLSGTGSDGSVGIKRVKEYGGIVFVQEPQEADYPDMPRNSIATGMVDYVLPVSEIPAKILSYKEHLGSIKIEEVEESAPSEERPLLDIFTQLRVRTGHDFSDYKRATILRRIERRISLRELQTLDAYSRYLREHPKEVYLLMKDLLISVTNFFRDAEAIEALAEKVIPKILERKDPEDLVRVWVAGCATGEEAYSLAMLFIEQIENAARPSRLQIFATDLDQDAIQVAREGYYSEAEVADVTQERLRRFFNREGDGYRIRRELRETVLFALHNVLRDPPFSHLDLVSCRNLLIYLNRTAQGKVLEVMHFSLNRSGFLFLGASESIEGAKDLFSVIDKDHHIFRSRPVPPRSFPIPEINVRPIPLSLSTRQTTSEHKRAMERLSYADLHQRLLERYAAPSVIVNEDYEIVHLSDRAGEYMEIGGGEPTHNLLKMIRPEIRLELRTALYQAVNDRVNVETRCTFGTGEHRKVVNLIVRPVFTEDDETRGFILVVFDEVSDDDPASKTDLPRSADPLAGRLEAELVHLKSQLRATVEQYEVQQEELRASNEELQAMNEELRSSAEELETSKEELQSVNEELTTVNQELKIKIEELSQANNNFQNLMNSTNIGTIFLDRSLKVRQFTPSAVQLFNLIPSDIGRPLMDITSKFAELDLLTDIELVLAKLQTIEREVRTADGRSYVMALTPYRTMDDKIDGVVITLVDISEQVRGREYLSKAQLELENRVAARTKELASSNESLRIEMSERAGLEDSRLQLMSQLVSAQEDERRRFAMDLHDQLGQQLTALKIRLENLGKELKDEPAVAPSIDELKDMVRQLNNEVDFLAWQMRPVVLDDLGLASALQKYVRQWSTHFGIEAEFRVGETGEGRFPVQIETNLYRVAQEALNNCAKHANCTRAEVLLERHAHRVVLIVSDNGDGFDPNKIVSQGRWGLFGMHERARLIGGSVEVESTPGEGTTIYVRVPI